MAFNRTMKVALALPLAGVFALTACSGSSEPAVEDSGESVTINLVTMVLPESPNGLAAEWFFSQLEERSNGRITVDRTEPESICKAPEIAQCVIDGRGDLGVSISDYSASLFPSMSVAGIPFVTNNPAAQMEALYEVNTTNESAIAQWEKNGIAYMGGWSPGTTLIGSNGPVDNISDLNGMQLRAIGSSLPAAYAAVGANVVSMPAAETYENVERGVIDGVSWTTDGAVDYKLMEQLDTWTDPGAGAYTTFAMWMNQSFYDGLPDDLRQIVDEVREDFNKGGAMEAFDTAVEEQCTTLIEFPNTKSLSAWKESATAEWKDLTQKDLIAAYVAQAEKDGLADAQQYYDDYIKALDKASGGVESANPFMTCVERFNEKG